MLGFCLPFPSDEPDNFLRIPFIGMIMKAFQRLQVTMCVVLKKRHAKFYVLEGYSVLHECNAEHASLIIRCQIFMIYVCAALLDCTSRSEGLYTRVPANLAAQAMLVS